MKSSKNLQKHKNYHFISIDETLQLHDLILKKYGGSPGIRDLKLLESALHEPQTTIFGKFAYKNVYEIAAAYCYHLIKNHGFVDGNKRTGLLIILTFLERNGLLIKPEALFTNWL